MFMIRGFIEWESGNELKAALDCFYIFEIFLEEGEQGFVLVSF